MLLEPKRTDEKFPLFGKQAEISLFCHSFRFPVSFSLSACPTSLSIHLSPGGFVTQGVDLGLAFMHCHHNRWLGDPGSSVLHQFLLGMLQLGLEIFVLLLEVYIEFGNTPEQIDFHLLAGTNLVHLEQLILETLALELVVIHHLFSRFGLQRLEVLLD